MALSGKQKNYLRGLAHSRHPIVTIGNKGLTTAFLAELELALQQHELVKIKIPGASKAEKAALLNEVATRSESELIQQIGNIGVLFRVSEEARIRLPD